MLECGGGGGVAGFGDIWRRQSQMSKGCMSGEGTEMSTVEYVNPKQSGWRDSGVSIIRREGCWYERCLNERVQ